MDWYTTFSLSKNIFVLIIYFLYSTLRWYSERKKYKIKNDLNVIKKIYIKIIKIKKIYISDTEEASETDIPNHDEPIEIKEQ